MATEEPLQLSAASMVEDVLQQHGKSLNDVDWASRRAEEAAMRRNEATGWLRKTVGVVAAKDLPAEPSEEAFLQGLRSGIILCNVLNKVQPGAVQKVIDKPSDSAVIPDGAALSAYQYFENIRNFLVAVGDMGLPTFEASDLEQGGKTSRVVNCVLALKSYSESKQGGGNVLKRFGSVKGGTLSVKQFVLKNSEPFMNSLAKALSTAEKSIERSTSEPLLHTDIETDYGDKVNPSLRTLIRGLLADKKQEDIPLIVESMISKVMEEFEQRLAKQNSQIKAQPCSNGSPKKPTKIIQTEVVSPAVINQENRDLKKDIANGDSNTQIETPVAILTPKKDIINGDSNTQIETPVQLEENQLGEIQAEIKTPSATDQENCDLKEDIGNDNSNTPVEGQLLLHEKQLEEIQTEIRTPPAINQESCDLEKDDSNAKWKAQMERQLLLVKKQHGDIQVLKSTMLATKEDLNFLQKKYSEEVDNLGTHLRTLARAASGYKKVLEENRKLYNQVQDLKGNIRVYCRVRPVKGKVGGLGSVEHLDEGSITITNPSKTGKDGKKAFTFNRVFGPSVTQAEVFSDTQPLIRSVLDGFNVCIFAYGQTGSGKTHTMSGPDVITPETMGVNYRALGDLFQISEDRKDTILYEVSVQMLEIYNEQVRDLLATDGSNRRLEIRNNSQKGLNVPDANIMHVTGTADVINLMNLGHKNRAVGSTAMNDRSSRSHSCLTVHVQGKDLASGSTIRGCMHLVDLAGSERVDKTEATGDRLKEAQHINKSLAALGDVIASLAQKNAHVPYRNSKLTQLLQDSLGGQAKTLMFVHISPDLDAIGETISTLKFAERVSSVELGAAKSNKDNSEVKDLKEQIASLRAALIKKEGESVRSLHSSLSSAGSSPSRYGLSMSNSGDQGQHMEDVDNLLKSNLSKPKRKSLDPLDLINSPPWPSVGNPESKDSDKESVSSDWVDKVMVNKQDGDRRDSVGSLDDFDELDATTSDCSSEQDFHWHANAPQKVTSIPNGTGSKLKKPSQKQPRSAETRSAIPAPHHSRRLSGSPAASKTGKPGDGKRKPGGGK